MGKTLQKLIVVVVTSTLALPCAAKSGKGVEKKTPSQTAVTKQRIIVNKAGHKDTRIGTKTGTAKGTSDGAAGGGSNTSEATHPGDKLVDKAKESASGTPSLPPPSTSSGANPNPNPPRPQ